MSKKIIITIKHPNVITYEYWEKLENKLTYLLQDYRIQGEIFNEVTANSMTINKKDA